MISEKITPYRFYIDIACGGQNTRTWLENIDAAKRLMDLLADYPAIAVAELWDTEEHRCIKRLRA